MAVLRLGAAFFAVLRLGAAFFLVVVVALRFAVAAFLTTLRLVVALRAVDFLAALGFAGALRFAVVRLMAIENFLQTLTLSFLTSMSINKEIKNTSLFFVLFILNYIYFSFNFNLR